MKAINGVAVPAGMRTTRRLSGHRITTEKMHLC
jgi:hypothetical protein